MEYLKFIQPPNVIQYSDLDTSGNKLNDIELNLNSQSGQVISLDRLLRFRDNLGINAKCYKEWKAHRNGVSVITSNSDPLFYATAGLDFKVFIWNENFDKIGSLTTIKDPEWSLKIDVEKELERRREQAVELYNELKEISYDNLFDGQAKLHDLDDSDSNFDDN